MSYTCPKTITASAARGFGRKAARMDERDDAGRALRRDVRECPAIRQHADTYIRAYWDEKVSITDPALHERLLDGPRRRRRRR